MKKLPRRITKRADRVSYYIVDTCHRRVYHIGASDPKKGLQYGHEVWPRQWVPWRISNKELVCGLENQFCYVTQQVPWIPRKWPLFHGGGTPSGIEASEDVSVSRK